MIVNYDPRFTKKALATRLVEEDALVLQCLLVLHGRQTDVEQARKETITKNKCGFMSSHAVNGTLLAEAALNGTLPNDDSFKGRPVSSMEMARSIVIRYTKQLAAHFRQNLGV